MIEERPAPDDVGDGVPVDGLVDEPADRRGRRGVSPVWRVAAVVLVLLSGVAVGAWLSERGRADDAEATVESSVAAQTAASTFVQKLLTYDFDALDEQRDAVSELSTDRFRDEFLAAFTDDLRAAIEQEEASSSATVIDVFQTPDGDGRARAVVHVESELVSGQGVETSLESYLLVTLIERDGRWLVDEMVSLGSREQGGGS